MRNTHKTIAIWLLLLAIFVAVVYHFSEGSKQVNDPTFTQFMASVEAGEIKEVTITEGIRYEGTSGADNARFETIGPEADAAILSRLTDAGVDVRFRPPDSNGPLLTILGQ